MSQFTIVQAILVAGALTYSVYSYTQGRRTLAVVREAVKEAGIQTDGSDRELAMYQGDVRISNRVLQAGVGNYHHHNQSMQAGMLAFMILAFALLAAIYPVPGGVRVTAAVIMGLLGVVGLIWGFLDYYFYDHRHGFKSHHLVTMIGGALLLWQAYTLIYWVKPKA